MIRSLFVSFGKACPLRIISYHVKVSLISPMVFQPLVLPHILPKVKHVATQGACGSSTPPPHDKFRYYQDTCRFISAFFGCFAQARIFPGAQMLPWGFCEVS